jgi:MoaA/NifB/PqqE/SkfB family radical SAM enzyme
LPETVVEVQFGGVGDPLTHKNWLEIITSFRARGIRVEILTNLDCITVEELDILHSNSLPQYALHLIVNLSAGNRQSYSIVRPRQSMQTFDRIIGNIEYLSALKKRDGHGVDITLLNVINKYNFQDMCEMVELGHLYNSRVWLKPLEVHSELHRRFEIPTSEMKTYNQLIQNAISLAKKYQIELSYDSLYYFKGEQGE